MKMGSLATKTEPMDLPSHTVSEGIHPVRRPTGHFYRPELDVLRLFAFLSVFFYHGLPGMVVANHSGWMARAALFETTIKDAGSFGVCLFFTLSAYLITELLTREKTNTTTVHVQSFYARRVLRIWPLYFAFLFFGALLGLVINSYAVEVKRMLAFLFLSGNWYVAKIGCAANPTAPLWSISVEEQFYLVWPWIAKWGGKLWIGLVSVALFPISWFWLVALTRTGADLNRTIWLNSFVQFQFFALGALLALLLHGRVLHLRWFGRILLLLGGAAAWLIADGVFHVKRADLVAQSDRVLAGYGFVAVGCALFLLGFLGTSRRWLPGPLIYLGKISYGLYVFHMLCLDISWTLFRPALEHFVDGERVALGVWHKILQSGPAYLLVDGLALAMTIALAMLSYRFLEQPFLRMKDRFTFIHSRSV